MIADQRPDEVIAATALTMLVLVMGVYSVGVASLEVQRAKYFLAAKASSWGIDRGQIGVTEDMIPALVRAVEEEGVLVPQAQDVDEKIVCIPFDNLERLIGTEQCPRP